MRMQLRATDGGFIEDEDAIGFSFSVIDAEGDEHYLNLQRQPESHPAEEDDGIYIEFDDQSSGGYGYIGACRLSREMMSLDFSKPVTSSLAMLTGLDVNLSDIADDEYAALANGLPRAFRGFSELLSIH